MGFSRQGYWSGLPCPPPGDLLNSGIVPGSHVPALAGGFFTTSATYNFLGGSDGKEFACDAGDLGLIPRSGRSPGGGNGNPLQYSWLENSMDRGAWWATVRGPKESDKSEHFGVHDLGQMLNLDLYLALISGKAVIALQHITQPQNENCL